MAGDASPADEPGGDRRRGLDPATTSALLWGLVGALAFGALYQGYVLLGGEFDAVALVGGALAVGAVTVVLAYALERRLPELLG